MLVVSTAAPNTAVAVTQAIDGGVDAVQLRVDLPPPCLAAILHAAIGRATVIYNAQLAPGGGPSSVTHLQVPQRLLGPQTAGEIWGGSVHSVEAALRAQQLGAAWLVAGNIYLTSSHPNRPGRGVQWLHEVCSAATAPVLAIGGIEPANVSSCIQAGAAGVAVSSYILNAPSPQRAAAALHRELQRCGSGSSAPAQEPT